MTAVDVVITIRKLGISGSIRALEQVTASVEGEDTLVGVTTETGLSGTISSTEELTGDID